MTGIQEIIRHKDTGEYIMIEGYPKMPDKYRIIAKNRYGQPIERIHAYLSLGDAKERLAKLASNLNALDRRWIKSTTGSILTETYGRDGRYHSPCIFVDWVHRVYWFAEELETGDYMIRLTKLNKTKDTLVAYSFKSKHLIMERLENAILQEHLFPYPHCQDDYHAMLRLEKLIARIGYFQVLRDEAFMKVIGLKEKGSLSDQQIAVERQKMVDYDAQVNTLMSVHKIDHLQVARYLDGLGYDGHCTPKLLDTLAQTWQSQQADKDCSREISDQR